MRHRDKFAVSVGCRCPVPSQRPPNPTLTLALTFTNDRRIGGGKLVTCAGGMPRCQFVDKVRHRSLDSPDGRDLPSLAIGCSRLPGLLVLLLLKLPLSLSRPWLLQLCGALIRVVVVVLMLVMPFREGRQKMHTAVVLPYIYTDKPTAYSSWYITRTGMHTAYYQQGVGSLARACTALLPLIQLWPDFRIAWLPNSLALDIHIGRN